MLHLPPLLKFETLKMARFLYSYRRGASPCLMTVHSRAADDDVTGVAFAWVSKCDKSATRASGNTFELSSLISVCDVVSGQRRRPMAWRLGRRKCGSGYGVRTDRYFIASRALWCLSAGRNTVSEERRRTGGMRAFRGGFDGGAY